MGEPPRTRFAPTPSGFLHLGNAVNALLCAWTAEGTGGALLLRIDDLDRDRCRATYEEDILDLTGWLGLEFAGVIRQSTRMARYREALDVLLDSSLEAFACRCSRSELAAGLPCRCDEAGLPLETGVTALKWHAGAGDVVLWRRDGIPAYHLASVVDDDDLGITHIVRGEDLREATAVQQALAVPLGAHGFASASIGFHGLLTDASGEKLSKSQLSSQADGPLPRTPETRAAIHAAALRLADAHGLPHP